MQCEIELGDEMGHCAVNFKLCRSKGEKGTVQEDATFVECWLKRKELKIDVEWGGENGCDKAGKGCGG